MSIRANVSGDASMPLSAYVYVAYSVVYILLLPVFIFVICVGFQQCRKPRSRTSTTTDSDVFTFHMAALEVLRIVGACVIVSCFGGPGEEVGLSLSYMTTFGQAMFHLLVCLERYLAVVHPITYLHLKQKGVVMRNLSIGVVWLFNCVMVYLYLLNGHVSFYFSFITGLFSLTVISFFCARVLIVLIRPGPGGRRHVDQSKRRAFYTIAAITVALLLKYVTIIVKRILFVSKVLNDSQELFLSASTQWFNIPGSLVLPLPFLWRRAQRGKTSS